MGVVEPVEWICTQADKDFASLWVNGKYAKRPLGEMIDELEEKK